MNIYYLVVSDINSKRNTNSDFNRDPIIWHVYEMMKSWTKCWSHAWNVLCYFFLSWFLPAMHDRLLVNQLSIKPLAACEMLKTHPSITKNNPRITPKTKQNETMWQCNGKKTVMMTSSNGNIFRVTGPLCGEFTEDRWIPYTKASDAELWC